MLDVTKRKALAEWTRQREFAREHVLAIGDNWNDQQMLESRGVLR